MRSIPEWHLRRGCWGHGSAYPHPPCSLERHSWAEPAGWPLAPWEVRRNRGPQWKGDVRMGKSGRIVPATWQFCRHPLGKALWITLGSPWASLKGQRARILCISVAPEPSLAQVRGSFGDPTNVWWMYGQINEIHLILVKKCSSFIAFAFLNGNGNG